MICCTSHQRAPASSPQYQRCEADRNKKSSVTGIKTAAFLCDSMLMKRGIYINTKFYGSRSYIQGLQISCKKICLIETRLNISLCIQIAFRCPEATKNIMLKQNVQNNSTLLNVQILIWGHDACNCCDYSDNNSFNCQNRK
jgi:hypothetical protein